MAERRAEEAARERRYINSKPINKAKQKRLTVARQTQTELLLQDLSVYSMDDAQIICMSATIGRTMQRQLMQILDDPSVDAAATLVTSDTDERVKSKNAERRKSILLPVGLKHRYCVEVEDDGVAKDRHWCCSSHWLYTSLWRCCHTKLSNSAVSNCYVIASYPQQRLSIAMQQLCHGLAKSFSCRHVVHNTMCA